MHTGLKIQVPFGSYGRIAPRYGLALKKMIDVGAGVIDRGYTSPVGILLINMSDIPFHVKAGDKIAQLILEQIITPPVFEVKTLEKSNRGNEGFGSTGMWKKKKKITNASDILFSFNDDRVSIKSRSCFRLWI